MTLLSIRRAGPGDAAPLAALAERSFRDTFAALNTADNMERHCALHFGADIQRREIADPAIVTMLAEDAGRLVGFSQLRLSHATECVTARRPAELNRIYVAADRLGGGVAQELMQNTLATAADAGCDCVWLGVWEHNARAIAFYRKLGFRVVGDHAFTLGQERQRDLIMVTELG